MSAKFFQIKSFFTYWLDAVDEHSLHSPFLFDFYTNVLKKELSYPDLQLLAGIREKFENDHTIINVTDFGAGSLKMKTSSRKISDIARISTTPEKYSKLYSRIVRHYHCHQILELGTSLGINTLCLAKAHKEVQVTTIEGSREIARLAKQMFEDNSIKNIKVLEGNIDETLPSYLEAAEQIDFAFIDANHRLTPTLNYFEQILHKVHNKSIVVLDDIHYSHEMEEAWKVLQTHERVYTTIDLYRCGLVFFNPSLTKQNAVLQY
ncbi:MAG TPA: class I SAM-dependent methyltransferase [Chryseolinea sp.]|nr:class I SAM-dependent methyltransferase [Chryseolinea sp.]